MADGSSPRARMRFRFGALTLDAAEFGVQANAILGIKESGKTYTATALAEKLHDAGVPFITFDPTGLHRFMRVPGAGKGYPIVVAGGEGQDLPLTPATAPTIVEAAMRAGVSLVLDLSDPSLSKTQWRAIVKDSAKLLLHKNRTHGLRHVFLEEAAEFVPQIIRDGDVFDAVEKLVRIGGNARLGVTLVNPRAQEINKAVLELCENVFLHRQRGKNALQNLQKWLEVAGAEEAKAITASLPELPQGECWAWIGGDTPQPPTRIKVPRKNSHHPDRRVMRGDEELTSGKAVDVGRFLDSLKSALPKIEAEAAANDPKALQREVARLKTELAQMSKARPAPASIVQGIPEKEAHRREVEKFRAGYVHGFANALAKASAGIAALKIPAEKDVPFPYGDAPAKPLPPAAATTPDSNPPPAALPKPAPKLTEVLTPGALSGPQRTLLQALAWWRVMGHDAPLRNQVAAIAGWAASSSHLRNRLSELRQKALIEDQPGGRIALTAEGLAAAPEPDTSSNMLDGVRKILTGPQRALFEALLETPDWSLDRASLAAAVGWEVASSHLRNRLSELRTLQIIDDAPGGGVSLQSWLSA